MSSNIGNTLGNGERKIQLSYPMGEKLDFDFGYEKAKGKGFLKSPAISLYVKSGENDVFRLEPDKEVIGWKGLLICVAVGFLLGFFVLPLIFG